VRDVAGRNLADGNGGGDQSRARVLNPAKYQPANSPSRQFSNSFLPSAILQFVILFTLLWR
jgi:hypothetical protein